MTEQIYNGPRLTYLDIAEEKVFMADPETTVSEIANTMVAHWIDSIFIVDRDEHILGIVTDGILLTLIAKEQDFKGLKAGDIMAKPVYCVRANEQVVPYDKLKETFSKKHNRVNRVAIIDNNEKLIGVLNTNFLKKIGHFSRSFDITLKKKRVNMTEKLPDNVLIRNYRKSDYEETSKIMEEMSVLNDLSFNRDKWNESAGLRLFQPGYSRTTLVAEIDRNIVGMGFIELLTNSPDGLSIGYLSNWGVKAEYRGSGVGKALAEKAIAMLTAMGADLVRIKIAMKPDPSKLLKIVEAIGFESKYITVEKKIQKDIKKK